MVLLGEFERVLEVLRELVYLIISERLFLLFFFKGLL